jgi:hypothetical protein
MLGHNTATFRWKMNREISNRTFFFIKIKHPHFHMKHFVSNFLQKTKSSELHDIPSEAQMWLPTSFWLLPELKKDFRADQLINAFGLQKRN